MDSPMMLGRFTYRCGEF